METRTMHAARLTELREGEQGILDCLELEEEEAMHVMELGFIPGTRVVAGRSAPTGDPRVYRVCGAEIALRRETARHLLLRPETPDGERA